MRGPLSTTGHWDRGWGCCAARSIEALMTPAMYEPFGDYFDDDFDLQLKVKAYDYGTESALPQLCGGWALSPYHKPARRANVGLYVADRSSGAGVKAFRQQSSAKLWNNSASFAVEGSGPIAASKWPQSAFGNRHTHHEKPVRCPGGSRSPTLGTRITAAAPKRYRCASPSLGQASDVVCRGADDRHEKDKSGDAAGHTACWSPEEKLVHFIGVREKCVGTLKELVSGGMFCLTGCRKQLVETMYAIRTVSLAIVGLIEYMQKYQGVEREAFTWDGGNYLVKMIGDCEFLCAVPHLEEDLGVALKDNPFFSGLLIDGRDAFDARRLAHVDGRIAHEEALKPTKFQPGDPLVGLLDPLLNRADVRTNLRIQRACRVLRRELRHLRQKLDHEPQRTSQHSGATPLDFVSRHSFVEPPREKLQERLGRNPNFPPTRNRCSASPPPRGDLGRRGVRPSPVTEAHRHKAEGVDEELVEIAQLLHEVGMQLTGQAEERSTAADQRSLREPPTAGVPSLCVVDTAAGDAMRVKPTAAVTQALYDGALGLGSTPPPTAVAQDRDPTSVVQLDATTEEQPPTTPCDPCERFVDAFDQNTHVNQDTHVKARSTAPGSNSQEPLRAPPWQRTEPPTTCDALTTTALLSAREEPEVFTLSNIHTQLNGTLEYIRNLDQSYVHRRQSNLQPYFRRWKRFVRSHRVSQEHLAARRRKLLSMCLRSLRRWSRLRHQSQCVTRLQAKRVRMRAFRLWVMSGDETARCRLWLRRWVTYATLQRNSREGEAHRKVTQKARVRAALRCWQDVIARRTSLRQAYRHARQRRVATAALMLRVWRGRAVARRSMLTALQRWHTRQISATRAAIRLWRRRIVGRLACRKADIWLYRRFSRKAEDALRSWREATRRALLIDRATVKRDRAICRTAIRTFRRRAAVKRFFRSRRIGEAKPNGLDQRHSIKHFFERWMGWYEVLTTIELIFIVWRLQRLRDGFAKWKGVHSPPQSAIGRISSMFRRPSGRMPSHIRRARPLAGLYGLSMRMNPRLKHLAGCTSWTVLNACTKPPELEAPTPSCETPAVANAVQQSNGNVSGPSESISPVSATSPSSAGGSTCVSRHRQAVHRARLERRAAKRPHGGDCTALGARQGAIPLSAARPSILMEERIAQASPRSRDAQSTTSTHTTDTLSTHPPRLSKARKARSEKWKARHAPSVAAEIEVETLRRQVEDLRRLLLLRELEHREPQRRAGHDMSEHVDTLSRGVLGEGDAVSDKTGINGLVVHVPASHVTVEPAPKADAMTELYEASTRASLPELMACEEGHPEPQPYTHDTFVECSIENDHEGRGAHAQAADTFVSSTHASLHSNPSMDLVDIPMTTAEVIDQPISFQMQQAAVTEHEIWTTPDTAEAPEAHAEPTPPPTQCDTSQGLVGQAACGWDGVDGLLAAANESLAVPEGGGFVYAPPHTEGGTLLAVARQTTSESYSQGHDTNTQVCTRPSTIDQDVAAAIAIQRTWRGAAVRKGVRSKRSQAAGRKFREGLDEMLDGAASTIQKHWRGQLVRKTHKRRQKRGRSSSPQTSTAPATQLLHQDAGIYQAHANDLRPIASASVTPEHAEVASESAADALPQQEAPSPQRGLTLTPPYHVMADLLDEPQQLPTPSSPAGTRGLMAALDDVLHGAGARGIETNAVRPPPPVQRDVLTATPDGRDQPAAVHQVMTRRDMVKCVFASVTSGDLQTLLSLIEQGVDLSMRNDDGETLLSKAVLSTSDHAEEVITLLIEAGADVNGVDDTGRTPLMTCLTFGVDDLVPALLSANASLHVRHEGLGTVFHVAVNEHLMDCLELMTLEDERRGDAAVNVTDGEGVTPLHMAVKLGILSAVDILLQHPAIATNIPDCQGQTALMAAALLNDHESIRKLLEHGADPRIGAPTGLNVVFTAADRADPALVELLGTCAAGRHVDAADSLGNTTLHYSVMKHEPDLVRLLISMGADASLKNDAGYTAAELAAQYGFTEIQEMLWRADEEHEQTGAEHRWSYVNARQMYSGDEQAMRAMRDEGPQLDYKGEDPDAAGDVVEGWGDDVAVEGPPEEDDDMYVF